MDLVEVVFHPCTYDRFFKPLEASHPRLLEVLVEDFRRYQQTLRDDLPDYFGLDAEYGSPPEIAGCIEHIHLCIPPRTFAKHKRQFDRRCRQGDPENDVALVYARGLFDSHKFCLIAILMPDAHGQCRNNELMLYLGRLGREFRNDN